MITGMPRIAIAVRDFPRAVAVFRDALGMPVVDLSATSVGDLGARLAMCVPEGGSNIELMSPADPAAPLSQSLQRFLDRRGEGLFALMLEAPDPDAEAAELRGRGLNVLPVMAGAGGRDVHPNSTHGVLIRVYPTNSFRRDPGTAAASPGPGSLSGIRRVIIAVRDLVGAERAYRERLGLPSDAPVADPDRGVRVLRCRPGTGGVIEIVSPVDATRPFAAAIARFLGERTEGMYALVLAARDPAAASDRLRAAGLEVEPAADCATVMEVQRRSAFGALLRIEGSEL